MLSERGHEVAVFTRCQGEGQGLACRTDGTVQVWTAWAGAPSPTRRFLAAFGDDSLSRSFRQVFERFSPDRVHIQHLMGLPLDVATQVLDADVPYFVTLHDYWWVCANAQLLTNSDQQICDGPRRYLNCARCALARAEFPHSWPALPLLAILMGWRAHRLRQVLHSAESVIAPTSFVRDWYAAHGVSPEKISMIPHGIELPDPRPSRSREDDRRLRFVYIGGLSWQKGVHIALEAFRGLYGDAELWLAGDESAEPAYVERLRRQSRGLAVRFLGLLDHHAVWQTLADADVALVPSLWYETSSLFAQEALAMGLPVVASGVGALRERVRDGIDGLLVPPGDVLSWRAALQRLVDERDLLQRLRNNILPVTSLFDHATQLESLYVRS
jgi:glycosyltransferase involved in cell wall biosynthesis